MIRFALTPALFASLLVLSSCVAAIGNTGYATFDLPEAALPLLEEKIEAAQRILELRERRSEDLREKLAAGRADSTAAFEADIAVEEARIVLLQFRAELEAFRSRNQESGD